VIKEFDTPLIEIVDGTRAVSTPEAKLLRNRGILIDYLGHAH
jgi:hypothetical protein